MKSDFLCHTQYVSAIAGIYYRNARNVDVDDLRKMSVALDGHGPDDEAIRRDCEIGLIHRLRRFTPEDAFESQPVTVAEPPLTVVCAGRIDNRKELLRRLGMVDTGAIADSRIAAEAFARWGAEAASRLAGDYTAAVWDAVERSLLIVAAPCSSRPIFYHHSNNRFVFATMPSGLFALGDVPREIDEEYVAKYLSRIPRDMEASFYRGIRRVPPGHRLRVGRDGLQVDRYWRPETLPEIRLSRDEDYVDAFLELYNEVVVDHMRSTGGIGIMLSGGLDSTSVAAMAAPRLAKRGEVLRAYTAVPGPNFDTKSTGRLLDESALARAMASLYDNIDLRCVARDVPHFLIDDESLFRHAEWPFRNAFNRPWFEALLRTGATDGVNVMLKGSHGNLTVSWRGVDPIRRHIRQGSWRRAYGEAAAAFASTGETPLALTLRRGAGLFLPPPLRALKERWANRSTVAGHRPPESACTRQALRRFGLPRASKIGTDDPRTWEEARQVRSRVMTATSHAGAPLMTGYRAMFAVDLRDPTADKRIAEFCLALPEDQFAAAGTTRRLIRRSMAGRVPEEILHNERRGLQAADWIEQVHGLASHLDRTEMCDRVSMLIDCAALRKWLGILDATQATDHILDGSLRNYLENGLMTGAFLSWFETSTRGSREVATR